MVSKHPRNSVFIVIEALTAGYFAQLYLKSFNIVLVYGLILDHIVKAILIFHKARKIRGQRAAQESTEENLIPMYARGLRRVVVSLPVLIAFAGQHQLR